MGMPEWWSDGAWERRSAEAPGFSDSADSLLQYSSTLIVHRSGTPPLHYSITLPLEDEDDENEDDSKPVMTTR